MFEKSGATRSGDKTLRAGLRDAGVVDDQSDHLAATPLHAPQKILDFNVESFLRISV